MPIQLRDFNQKIPEQWCHAFEPQVCAVPNSPVIDSGPSSSSLWCASLLQPSPSSSISFQPLGYKSGEPYGTGLGAEHTGPRACYSFKSAGSTYLSTPLRQNVHRKCRQGWVLMLVCLWHGARCGEVQYNGSKRPPDIHMGRP